MIAGLILAAGDSSRMGRDKALLAYQGRTFLETVFNTLREAGIERIVVVLGHHAAEIQRVVNLRDVEVVVNADYRLGQTSSLQRGLQTVAASDVEAVVLSLVDHPAISARTIRELIDGFYASHAPVVIPTYQNQRGHPVVLSRALFPELLKLSPDEGANRVVRRYRDTTQFLEVDDEGILLDVDNGETYRSLRRGASESVP